MIPPTKKKKKTNQKNETKEKGNSKQKKPHLCMSCNQSTPRTPAAGEGTLLGAGPWRNWISRPREHHTARDRHRQQLIHVMKSAGAEGTWQVRCTGARVQSETELLRSCLKWKNLRLSAVEIRAFD